MSSNSSNIFTRIIQTATEYLNLEPEQKTLIRQRTLSSAHAPVYWLVFFKKLVSFDQKADHIRPKLGTGAAVLLPLSFFFNIFVLAFSLEMNDLTLFWILQSILIITWALGFICLLIYLILKTLDIQNSLRGFIVPLIAVLNEEMRATDLLHLEVDLRNKARKDNEVNRQTNYKKGLNWGKRIGLGIIGLSVLNLILGGVVWPDSYLEDRLISVFVSVFISIFVIVFSQFGGKYPRILHTTHQHPWLKIEARLYDGTRLLMAVEDEVNKFRITRKKRGSSGKTKIKTKTKYKIRQNYDIRLAVPGRKYDLSEQAVLPTRRNSEGVKMKTKETMRREVIKVNGRVKTKDLKFIPDLGKVLRWVADAYYSFEQKQNPA